MKKITTLCLVLVLTIIGAMQTQAQSFSYGITAGYNLTKMKFSGNWKESFSSDNKPGWFIGPKVAFNTPLGIGIDASLQYSQRKLNITGVTHYDMSNEEVIGGVSKSETYRTLEIPINVRYNIGLGKIAGIYVFTGPQFGFAFKNMEWSNFGSGTNFSKENMNTTWNIGAGVRLMKHLEASIGYNFALGKAGKAIFNNFGGETGNSQDLELKYKTNTFQVQVAYMF